MVLWTFSRWISAIICRFPLRIYFIVNLCAERIFHSFIQQSSSSSLGSCCFLAQLIFHEAKYEERKCSSEMKRSLSWSELASWCGWREETSSRKVRYQCNHLWFLLEARFVSSNGTYAIQSGFFCLLSSLHAALHFIIKIELHYE